MRRAISPVVKPPTRNRNRLRSLFLHICRRLRTDSAEWWPNTTSNMLPRSLGRFPAISVWWRTAWDGFYGSVQHFLLVCPVVNRTEGSLPPPASTSLQLARFIKRGTKNVYRKRMTCGFPRCGFRYRMDRWPSLQANDPQFPVTPSGIPVFPPLGPDVRSLLPDSHVISSWDVVWSDTELSNFLCLFLFLH